MTPVIVAEGLRRQFGETVAVAEVNLSVNAGSFFGFIGPNGAGKTTTIRLLTGLLTPTYGRISVFGKTYAEEGLAIKARIGLVQDDLLLYDYLTGEEQLVFTGRIYGLPQEEARRRQEELLSVMALGDCCKKLIRTYSHGERKKLALACALLHNPDILFLDEPFEGLDVLSLRVVEENLRLMVERGKTVFLSSHILSWVDRLCEEVAVINQGKVIFSGDRVRFREVIQEAEGQERTDSDLERAFLALIQVKDPGKELSWLQ